MAISQGIHGPVLGPLASLVMNGVLIGICMALLFHKKWRRDDGFLPLFSMVMVVSLVRVVLAPLPNIQPVTVACLIAGASLGARRGMSFAVLVALISNAFLGTGVWTIFQASGWAAIAYLGSKLELVNHHILNQKRLLLAAIFVSPLFNWWVSVSIFLEGMSIFNFIIYLAHGLPFDALHLLGSAAFAVWLGPWIFQNLTLAVGGQRAETVMKDVDVIVQ